MRLFYPFLFFFVLLPYLVSAANITSLPNQTPVSEEKFLEFFANLTTPDFVPSQDNTFYFTISCGIPSNRFMAGDIVDYQIKFCTSPLKCTVVKKYQLVYEMGCRNSFSFPYYVTADTYNLTASVMVKRFDEPFFTTFFTKNFVYIVKRGNGTEGYIGGIMPPKKEQSMFGFFSLPVIGIILVLLGIIMLVLKSVWGILPLLFGIILVFLGMFW